MCWTLSVKRLWTTHWQELPVLVVQMVFTGRPQTRLSVVWQLCHLYVDARHDHCPLATAESNLSSRSTNHSNLRLFFSKEEAVFYILGWHGEAGLIFFSQSICWSLAKNEKNSVGLWCSWERLKPNGKQIPVFSSLKWRNSSGERIGRRRWYGFALQAGF